MFDPYANRPTSYKAEIIPAVLPKDFSDLEKHVEQIYSAVKRVQVDIVDGTYAHGSTWPYRDHASFDKIVSEERGLPHWDTINYEFDLMIDNPLEKYMNFVRAGASHIIIHARSKNAVQAVQQLVDMREDGGAFSVQVGVALMADAQPEELDPFEAQFDYVQVMGIAKIGKQGEPFDVRGLHLIERLHSRYPELPLQVDGAVNKETAHNFFKAGARFLVAGSALFGADVPLDALKELESIANGTM